MLPSASAPPVLHTMKATAILSPNCDEDEEIVRIANSSRDPDWESVPSLFSPLCHSSIFLLCSCCCREN